ncbi:MAG TPA: DUF971 domain-containing protein [Oligoflexia bacterium]|nr:DUF971 domain-containing protein [Oligoflexia bacterium]HMP47359.1 DUF971 domain-containing protein [Oligoflexia bacterium]
MKNIITSKPSKIERILEGSNGDAEGAGLRITYQPDFRVVEFSSSLLRDNCPCAGCLQKRGDKSHDKPLGAPTSSGRSLLKVVSGPEGNYYDLRKVWTLGNYAIGIKWGDGHDTGIYSFEYLNTILGK